MKIKMTSPQILFLLLTLSSVVAFTFPKTERFTAGNVREKASKRLPPLANFAKPQQGQSVKPGTTVRNPEKKENARNLSSLNQEAGGLTVTDLTTSKPADLVASILSAGVSISNVKYTGAIDSAGTFSGGTGIIGFEGGIVLSTGSVRNVIGPNKSNSISQDNGLSGDKDLEKLIPGFTTHDATVLEFDFIPNADTILFQYVFSSDEYNEFANKEFNDVFGFFINGKNVALLPGINTAVAINNVNGGFPIGTNTKNPQFYVNNVLADGGENRNTEMDGLTRILSVQAKVNIGQINYIKLAIADAGDSSYDSNVFIKASSFTTNITPELIALEVTQGIQDLNNTVPLIQDKRTFVRAHVKSPQGDLLQVSAKIIGTRIEANGNRTSLGELPSSNIGMTILVKQDPMRINLGDSFYFELPGTPQDWRCGKVELEFRGISHNFKGCVPGSNICKSQVTFEQAPAPEMRMVGIVWRENDTRHEPTIKDLEKAAQQIEALFPIPRLNRDYPYNIEPVFFAGNPTTGFQFDRLNWMLGISRILDGCLGSPLGSCKRYYLGILTVPSGGVSGVIGQANNIPGEIATGYLDDLFTLAHEFGHDTGRHHTNYCGKHLCNAPVEGGPDPNYSPSDGTISEDKSDNGFFGFDLFGLLANHIVYGPDTPDLMSYGHPGWISPYTYTGIKRDLATRYGPSFAPLGATVDQPAGLAIMAGQPAVVVSGTVSFTQGTGEIGSIYAINSPASASAPSSGSYAIRFENSQGQLLATYNFEPDKPSDGSGEVGSFVLLLPLSTNTARIALLQNSQVIASRDVSANAPTVTVTYPNGGESLSGSTATFTWTASDPDGDPLSYVVQYSKDRGGTWQTLISDLNATSYKVNLNFLAGTNQALIRVLASDGFLTAQDQSDVTFTVAKHPPNPNIQSPENNRLYVSDQTIVLEGSGYDIEDGQMSDETLTWSSSVNGILGNGHTLSLNATELNEGNHTITLTAKDSEGQTSSVDINIQIVRERPFLPAKISAAPTGLSFTAKADGAQPLPQILAIRNDGDGTINWSAGADQSWLQLAFNNGITPANLPITVNLQGLKSGQYTGHITVTSPDIPNSIQVVEVVLNVTGAATADLSITNTASLNLVSLGLPLTYKVTVVNQGPDTATNVVVTDNLPAGVKFVSCAATSGGICAGTDNHRTVTFASLAPGTSASITLTTSIDCATFNGLSIINTATVVSLALDPVSANNSATAIIPTESLQRISRLCRRTVPIR